MAKSIPMKCPRCPQTRYYGKLWLPPEKHRDGSLYEYPIPVCETCGTECVPIRNG